MIAFGPAIVALGGVQAATAALPGAGLPAWLPKPRSAAWGLIAPGSIVAVVIVIAQLPQAADVLTWLAFLAIPPLAAAALGWAMRGARSLFALAAAPLFAVAWASVGSLAGQSAATILSALSCVTLGRLLAGIAPAWALKLGIIVAAIVDTWLIVYNKLQAPNAVLNAAVPAPGLPQLQVTAFASARMGYGDLFVAGLLGGTLAAEGRDTLRPALLVFALASLMDLLFLVTNELPATVPVALTLIVFEWHHGRRAGRRLGPRRGERAADVVSRAP